jgi:hypothetical protein
MRREGRKVLTIQGLSVITWEFCRLRATDKYADN